MKPDQAEDVETKTRQILSGVTELLRQLKAGGLGVKGAGFS